MPRVRHATRTALHDRWGRAAEAWTPTVLPTSFWSYTLRLGVTHLVKINADERARRRLSDLLFTGAYLDWCYSVLADDFSPVLRIWRVLGSEGAADAYREAVHQVRVPRPEYLLLLRQVVEFVRDAGWFDAAVDAAEASVKEHERLIGPKHPETAASQVQLGLALKANKRNDEAYPITERALELQRTALGPDDPELYVTMNSLASMLNAAKRYEEAEPLFREAIEHRTRLLGSDHPKTLISVASFAFMLTKMEKHAESEPFHRCAYEGRLSLLGALHPKTLASSVNLGRCLSELGRYDESEELLETAVEGRRAVLGVDHTRTQNAERRLAECRQKRDETHD